MSTVFEADQEQIAALLGELAAVTAYSRQLRAVVLAQTSAETGTWVGQASDSFTQTMSRWAVEQDAMAAELDAFTTHVAHASTQYQTASEAIQKAWA